MPLKVLLVESETHIFGGGHLSLLTLIRNFDPAFVIPTVACFGEGPFPERVRASGHTCAVIPRRGGVADIFLILRLAKLARTADLVHVNTLDIRAGLAARLAFRPLVGHLRVIFPFTWVDRWFVSLANRVIAVSGAVSDFYCSDAVHLLPKFQVIPNTVALDTPGKSDLRKQMGLSEETPLVGAVARIDPWKGLHNFVASAIRIAATHLDAHFLVVGAADPADPESTQYEAQLHSQVQDHGLEGRIHFLGFREDAHDIIRQLNVLAVPSTILRTLGGDKTEGFGRVVIEAMALGTPVVATRVGGIPEILKHEETGILVDADDELQMAQGITRILDDPGEAKRLIESAKTDFGRRFSLSVHLKQIEALYSSVSRRA